MTTFVAPQFRPFCDGCGIHFELDQLRPTSKFCVSCGQELLPYIRSQLVSLLPVQETPPITPAAEPLKPPSIPAPAPHEEVPVESECEDEADKNESGTFAVPPSTRGKRGGDWRGRAARAAARGRGRGKGRGKGSGRGGSVGQPMTPTTTTATTRGRGRDKGRGKARGRGTLMEPDVIPRPDGEAEVIDTPDITGPGLRSTERPDYSIQKNFREMLYGRKDTELDSPSKRRRMNSTTPTLAMDETILEPNETCGDEWEDATMSPFPEIPENLQRELEAPIKEYRIPHLARRSRPFGPIGSGITRNIDPRDQETQGASPTIPHPSESHTQTAAASDTESAVLNSGGMGDVIRLSDFQLGPTVDVPEALCVPFKHPGSVRKSGMVTYRESFNELMPSKPGQHGILYLDSPNLPAYVDPQNFGLLATYDLRTYNAKWHYLGQYRIHTTFTMTPAQWHNISERVKKARTYRQNVYGKARLWCQQNGIDVAVTSLGSGGYVEGFRKACDQGRWRFICHVVECVGFESGVYERLKNGTEEGDGSVVEGEDGN